MALEGSIVGWVIAEAIQLVIWFAFYKLFFVAYEQGVTFVTTRSAPVSYTHLDVYKRQPVFMSTLIFSISKSYPCGQIGVPSPFRFICIN